MTQSHREGYVSLLVAGVALANVLVALFLIPRSPGLDEPQLHSAVYASQRYGRLFYPYYDQPFMYLAPPTKYWLIARLGSLGLSVRLACAGLLLVAYLAVTVGVFACRLPFFRTLASLWAISAATTLHPFIAYGPENLTYAETIGRLRPDDLVLMLWLAGLFWLEASRRNAWKASYSFVGAFAAGLASVMHWYGVAGLGAVAVYGAAAWRDRGPARGRRLLLLAGGVVCAVLPCLLAVAPYLHEVARAVVTQQGDPSSRAPVDVWQRHAAGYRFLLAWTGRHMPSVWPQASLLSVPAAIGVPPLLFACAVLLWFRSSRVFGLAGLLLPLAMLCAPRKSSGYALPEIAFFLTACGWLLAAPLESLTGRRRWLAVSAFLVPIATASPLVWQPSELRLFDDRHSPDLLRAMGRAVVGPGASLVGPFYAGGEDRFVLDATPLDAGIDFVAEREFHLASGTLHRLYVHGQTRLAGFVLTPEAPSASLVYFTGKSDGPPLTGFVRWHGGIQRFSGLGSGWVFEVLRCRASRDELSWVSPPTAVPISGYVPRVDHCVSNTLRDRGLEGRFASLFLRRTWSFSVMADQVLVPLLIDAGAELSSRQALTIQCDCETLERISGSLRDVPAHWLLAGLERSERTIRFYASAGDLAAGRDMALRFGSRRPD